MKPAPKIDHEVHEFIRARWSPLAFSAAPLSEEEILSLFEAARWAASANNGQPWRFVWATPEDAERRAKLVACLKPGNDLWAPKAPLLALTVVRKTREKDGSPNPWALYDLGLAVGNMTAQATSMGLYLHNMAGFYEDKARELFSLEPGFDPVTMLAIGRLGDPAELPERLRAREEGERTRKPLSELFLR